MEEEVQCKDTDSGTMVSSCKPLGFGKGAVC